MILCSALLLVHFMDKKAYIAAQLRGIQIKRSKFQTAQMRVVFCAISIP
jgi:hypothetical protein